MTHRSKSAQSGRTMLEIISVMAVIGVLTIGSIAFYRFVMNYQQSKALYNDFKVRASLNMERKGRIFSTDMENKSTYDKEMTVDQDTPQYGFFKITAKGVEQAICKRLIKEEWPAHSRIYLDNKPLGSAITECPQKDVDFSVVYRSARTRQELPTLCINDNTCEGCTSCQNGECLAGCPSGKVCYNNSCVIGSCNQQPNGTEVCCPTEQALCVGGVDPIKAECPCVEPKECDSCSDECGTCDRYTGTCQTDDSKCQKNYWCGVTGICRMCQSGQIYSTETNRCITCNASIAKNAKTTEDECKNCGNQDFYFDRVGDCHGCNSQTASIYGTTKEWCDRCSNPKRYYWAETCAICDGINGVFNEDKTECLHTMYPNEKFFTANGTYLACTSTSTVRTSEEDCHSCDNRFMKNNPQKNDHAQCYSCQHSVWINLGSGQYDECHRCEDRASDVHGNCFYCNAEPSRISPYRTLESECLRCQAVNPRMYYDTSTKSCKICPEDLIDGVCTCALDTLTSKYQCQSCPNTEWSGASDTNGTCQCAEGYEYVVASDGTGSCKEKLANGCSYDKPIFYSGKCYACDSIVNASLITDWNNQCEEVCPNRDTMDIHCGGENPPYNKCVLKPEHWPKDYPLMQCTGKPVSCPTAKANQQIAPYNPLTREKYTSASEACHALCENVFFQTYCYHCDWDKKVDTSESECNQCENRVWDKSDCVYYGSGKWNDCSVQDGTCSGSQIRCSCNLTTTSQ